MEGPRRRAWYRYALTSAVTIMTAVLKTGDEFEAARKRALAARGDR